MTNLAEKLMVAGGVVTADCSKAVKIIDKHEKYLYTETDSFDKWKKKER